MKDINKLRTLPKKLEENKRDLYKFYVQEFTKYFPSDSPLPEYVSSKYFCFCVIYCKRFYKIDFSKNLKANMKINFRINR